MTPKTADSQDLITKSAAAELLPLEDVTVATVPKPQNGGGVPTAPELFAMHVDYVRIPCLFSPVSRGHTDKLPDYAKLTRKMGASKSILGGSNLRPKSLADGSP